jgi:hypothetical protein
MAQNSTVAKPVGGISIPKGFGFMADLPHESIELMKKSNFPWFKPV